MHASTLLASLLLLSCATALEPGEATALRARLRQAMAEPVHTRAQRDGRSRLLADTADSGALDRMNRAEVRAAFGPGSACRTELCAAQNFDEADWYYEIGHAAGPDAGRLPVLIFGFDARDRVERVYTLTHD